ncbi:MAG: 4Fe-4S binding protein [Phycisphaerae bacterium]|jgi:MinD superfamily P-loop ATPase
MGCTSSTPPAPTNAAPVTTDVRRHAVVDGDRCNLCGACEAVCPFEAVNLGGDFAVVNADLCRGCGACVSACPNEAIRLT